MDTKTTLPISEARKQLFGIAKKVQKPATHYTLTLNGRPKAVVISSEEFESLQDTAEAVNDFPNLKKDIQKAEREYKNGKYSFLEDVLAKEGFILADKA